MEQVLSEWTTRTESYFLAASVLLVAELIFPQSSYSVASRLRGITFRLIYIVITGTGLVLFGRLWASIGIMPLFHLNLNFLSGSDSVLAAFGGILASLMLLQISEFFYYWFHRAQHANNFLWRFHAVHHSIEELNAFNTNHHFTEELFRIPFVTIPISLLFSFEQGYVPWIWALVLGWQGIYEHSATKLNFGWFRYVIPDNRFHRIHHSKEQQHFDKNYGSGSALWDILFGTVHYPGREWPDVGLDQIKEPQSVSDFLFRPFQKQVALEPSFDSHDFRPRN
jgi:sterol desaturase/sphingolipid hydroxylase (fatty acid hydroxylase superfamily)